MKQKRLAIITKADDFHALVVQKELQERYNAICSIVEVDRLCELAGLTWSNVNDFRPSLPTTTGEHIHIRDLDLIWWRRGYVSQQIPSDITNPADIDLIANDFRYALLGLLSNEFRGVWISEPQATYQAQNKLIQLRVAQEVGFRTPQTLVSQDPQQIRQFCERLNNRVIAKVVKGTIKAPVLTIMVSEALLKAEESLKICPAIYQECIPGTSHVRANCFGDAVYAALIESTDLDWRHNLTVPVSSIDLPEDIKMRLRKVLNALGIKMGIFDLKFDEQGELVWLEVNPQGQFLFLEPLCNLHLSAAFSEFLYLEAG